MASGLSRDVAASDVARPRSRKRVVWAVAVLIALVAGLAWYALARGSGAPDQLASSYTMTFDNLSFDIQSDGSLTDVSQDEDGAIHGQMTVNSPLGGTGSFTGTYKDGAIEFKGAAEGAYTGTVDSDGAVTGTYLYSAGGYDGQHGNWTATPDEKPASSGGIPWWAWIVVLLLVVAAGLGIGRRLLRR
jgi:4-amino-4-deoxy-L-arabinose transferase-like glycosyltransferase